MSEKKTAFLRNLARAEILIPQIIFFLFKETKSDARYFDLRTQLI